MAIYYHGSSVLFKSFDLSHALEGDGKVKFGYGVYLTSRYERAAHYAFNKKRFNSKIRTTMTIVKKFIFLSCTAPYELSHGSACRILL